MTRLNARRLIGVALHLRRRTITPVTSTAQFAYELASAPLGAQGHTICDAAHRPWCMRAECWRMHRSRGRLRLACGASLRQKAARWRRWLRSWRRHPMTLHVMFSSLAALLPSAGQANYAAANAELDSAAHTCVLSAVPVDAIVQHRPRRASWVASCLSWIHSGAPAAEGCDSCNLPCLQHTVTLSQDRRSCHMPVSRLHHAGVPAVSIQWGPWAGAGMAAKTFSQASAAWRSMSLQSQVLKS